jgi:subtilisin family serine protease
MRLRIARSATLVAWVLVLSAWAEAADAQGRPERLPTERLGRQEVAAGEVLLKPRRGLSEAATSALERLADAAHSRPVGRTGVHRIRSRSLDTATLLARFRGHPAVEYVEPNFVVRATAEPNDPFLPSLWGLANTGQAVNGGAPGRPGADVHATAAWDLSFGSTSHVVAVIDTGIDYTHPDLASNMWSAPAAFTVTIGGVALTCPAGSHGFDAIAFTCDPMDDHHHGTHVAGTIGAAGGNGLGVVGVNWTTRLMGIRFLDASGAGTVADAIDGIEFALQARAAFSASGGADVRVLSNSWGGRDFSQALLDQIHATAAADMLFVAAAGNDGFSNDLWPAYPASYAASNVVAVAATTSTDDRAWFSNYGSGSVHLGAPGVDILSTTPSGAYGFSSGTSMAAPHVSGAGALVLSRCDLDAPTLKQALLATAEPVAGLAPYTITGGRLDVNGAIRSCAGALPPPEGLAARAGDGTVALSWTRVPGALRYTVKRSPSGGGPYATLVSVTTPAYSDNAVTNGTAYHYVVSATNFVGESADSTEASATPKAPSDLVVAVLTVPSTGGSGLPVSVTEATGNQGPGPSVPTTTRLYLSRNSLYDASDTPLGQHAVPALAAGAQNTAVLSLDLPSGLTPGYYYVIARADADLVETETQESNNATSRLITIGPDLAVPTMTVQTSAGAGSTIAVSATVKNQGGGAAAASVARFFLSVNAVWDASDLVLPGGLDVAPLAPGASAAGTANLTIPAGTTAGSYYVLARADGDGAVAETQEANNVAARLVQVGGDLVVSAVSAPSKAASGGPLAVTDTTKNNGAGAVAASMTRFYLSTNALYDAGDVLLAGGRAVPALAAGATSTGTITVTLPGGLSPGSWYVVARSDGDGAVPETLETNNTLARSVSTGPDLVVSAMSVAYNVRAGVAVAVSDTVLNQGAEASGGSTTRFYLSANAALDASDTLLDAARAVTPLAAGGSSAGSTLVTIPAGTASGNWFVLARADDAGAVAEGLESNNVAARAVRVSP